MPKTKSKTLEEQLLEEEAKKEYEEKFEAGIIKELVITTDIVHGWNTKIREIYIPNEGIFFNEETCGVIHVGRYDNAKNVGNVAVSKNFVEEMKNYLKARDSVKSFTESYKKELDINRRLKKK